VEMVGRVFPSLSPETLNAVIFKAFNEVDSSFCEPDSTLKTYNSFFLKIKKKHLMISYNCFIKQKGSGSNGTSVR